MKYRVHEFYTHPDYEDGNAFTTIFDVEGFEALARTLQNSVRYYKSALAEYPRIGLRIYTYRVHADGRSVLAPR